MARLSATGSNWIGISALPEMAPVTELAVFASAGGATLVAASAAGGGLVSFALSGSGSARFEDYRPYAPSPSGMSGMDLHLVTLAGRSSVMPLGPASGGGWGYSLEADGGLAARQSLDPASQLLAGSSGRITASLVVQEGSAAQLITAGTTGLISWQMQAGSLTRQDRVTLPASGDHVTALALAQGDIVLSAHADSDSLRSFRLLANGSLQALDAFGAADGAGIDTPTVLASATEGGRSYALLGAAGSDSLTVVAVGSDGSLTAVDHVNDSSRSYFANVSEIAVTRSGDWTLVVAAGSDGGCSIFALLPGGVLTPLADLPWSADGDRPLRAVSGLAMHVENSTLHIYASPEGGLGLQHLAVDLSGLGLLRSASAAGAQVNGGGRDDVLTAGNVNQVLTGGAGADVFVFTDAVANARGHLGRVSDFTPGSDRLDLSGLPLLRDGAQVRLVQSGSDLLLHYEGFSLTLTGVRLRDFDVDRDLMLEVLRTPVSQFPCPRRPRSTAPPAMTCWRMTTATGC